MYIHVKNKGILNIEAVTRIEIEVDTNPRSYGPTIWYYLKSKRVSLARYNTMKECYDVLEKIVGCLKAGEKVCEIIDGTPKYCTIDVTNVDGRTETLRYAGACMDDFLKSVVVNRHICDACYHIGIDRSSISLAEDCVSLEESLWAVEEFKEAIRNGDPEFSFVGKIKIDLDRHRRIDRAVKNMMDSAKP